jgi:uncharacterized repeat protein (TIGR03803 family)
MTIVNQWKFIVLFTLSAMAATVVNAQTFTTLVHFTGGNGGYPRSALTQGPDGRLYGTTTAGASNSVPLGKKTKMWGTLFAVDASGSLTTLANFNGVNGRGSNQTPLLAAPNGTLFGGNTTFYQTSVDGKLRVLGQIPDSGFNGPMAEGIDGSVYGVTLVGGDVGCGEDGCGAAYKVDPHGHVELLVTFAEGNNLTYPSGLMLGDDGNIYGITGSPDEDSYGNVFKMTPGGVLTTLYNFCSEANCADGYDPFSLIQGTDGNFYGVAYEGGNYRNTCATYFLEPVGCGTIFRLSRSGVYTVLHTFCTDAPCSDGGNPSWLVEGSDGALYGVTQLDGDPSCNGGYGCGTIFKITKDGAFTILYGFHTGDGQVPFGLTQATSGLFYGVQEVSPGVTCSLNEGQGCGTVFSFDIGLPPFVSVVRNFGRIGASDSIIGQGFIGATAVAFNGTPATFTVVSDTFLKTTIPQGATTGYVTVTTPSGVLTSNVQFHVIP